MLQPTPFRGATCYPGDDYGVKHEPEAGMGVRVLRRAASQRRIRQQRVVLAVR